MPRLSTESDNDYEARVLAMSPASRLAELQAELQANDEEAIQLASDLEHLGAGKGAVDDDLPVDKDGSVRSNSIT
jgi:hypothetical protein